MIRSSAFAPFRRLLAAFLLGALAAATPACSPDSPADDDVPCGAHPAGRCVAPTARRCFEFCETASACLCVDVAGAACGASCTGRCLRQPDNAVTDELRPAIVACDTAVAQARAERDEAAR